MPKSPKTDQKVSDYWHNPATLTQFFRARTYLASARKHGVRAIDAIHTALNWTTPDTHPADCLTQGSPANEYVASSRDRWNTTGELTSSA